MPASESTNPASAAHRQLLLGCRCAGTCGVLGVDDWGDSASFPDDEPWAWSFEFFNRAGSGPGTLGYRIKLAWRILLGHDHFIEAVCLDGNDVAKLRDFLNEGLGAK